MLKLQPRGRLRLKTKKEVEVKYTDEIRLNGDSRNYIEITLPENLYMKYNGEWYEPKAKVTVHADKSIRFAMPVSILTDEETTISLDTLLWTDRM